MVPLKRRRVQSSLGSAATSSDNTAKTGIDTGNKFPDVVVFLLERKMGASRRSFLSQLGRSKGFQVEESFSQSVTHVISEKNSGDDVTTWLDSQEGRGGQNGDAVFHLLDISWYTDSMREGRPVDILDRHRLQQTQNNGAQPAEFSVPGYACQRSTPLQGQNTLLTDAFWLSPREVFQARPIGRRPLGRPRARWRDYVSVLASEPLGKPQFELADVARDALSILADSAELSSNEGRGAAFRRAAAVLKSLPKPVTSMEQLRSLPRLGDHSRRVIKEILEDGVSSEVEATKQSEQYKVMKVLTGIFGVGAKTANRWFREGIHTLSQLNALHHTLNRAQQAGLDYYDDLNLPVTKVEADAIGQIVEMAVQAVLPGATITLTGGFRRGKPTGHDVDFLITHPEEGKEEGLVAKVVSWLESQGFLLYQKTTRNSYLESKEGPCMPSSNMDRFERCFSIFRLTGDKFRSQTQDLKQSEAQTPGGNCLHTIKETHLKTEHNIESPTNGSKEVHLHGTTLPHLMDPGPSACQTSLSCSAHAQTERLEDQIQNPGSKPWRAVRVDLIVSPVSQFPFALLGWTGSKLFERDLRLWAGHEKSMSLNSHSLYDTKQGKYLRACSEEEIFAHLGLEYIPPTERNA